MYDKRDAMNANEKLKIKNGNVKRKNSARKINWQNQCQRLSMKMQRFVFTVQQFQYEREKNFSSLDIGKR